MSKELETKTAIVTGASHGIGKAIALTLAENGFHLAITSGTDQAALQNVAEQIKTCSSSPLTFLGDIKNASFVREMMEKIKQHFGQIDVLVNNAGISYVGLLTDMTNEDWDNVINTNLSSVFYTCKEVVPAMVHQKSGHIINISSVWGNIGASCEVAYSASKGGVNSFTKALAKELAPSNISVNAISCGAIDTRMNHFLNEEEFNSLIEEIPAGRLGKTKEVADLVYKIATSDSYLTGQIISLDGGWC